MLVWGDQVRTECPRERLACLADALRRLAGMPAGIGRHAALVAALVDAGELAQGLADARFSEAGCDTRSPVDVAATALLARIAGAVRASWASGFARLDLAPEDEIRALAAAPLPGEVRAKRAEGFALYSLYPESYLEAAAAAARRAGRPTRVIGIRSIGAPLAALVAVALGAPPPVTVRPAGDPPRRKLALAEELAAGLLADAASSARFAVVDEGPGLSGSSFGAVADFLEDRGVAPGRIHFFASHRGPLAPSHARPRHRRRWARATRHAAVDAAVDLGDLLLHAPRRPEHRLDTWVADLVGEPEGPPEEISGGRWRPLRYAREADWPASNLYLERRKFLLRAGGGGGTWLLKFAGLGREGARKLDRARALHAAGFGPEVAGYRHGFLVERWLGDTPSLDQGFGDRDRLVAQVGRYLGFRARHFPAGEPGRGAPLARLWEMARFNTGLAMGESLARRLDRWAPALGRLAGRVRRVETDNRPHAWEWLLARDGRLLCEALLSRDSERGAALWRALRLTVMTRFIGAAGVEELLHIAFRAPDSPAVEALRDELFSLERCHTDKALCELATVATYNGKAEWLTTKMELDEASSRAWRRARGVALAGFTATNDLPVMGAWPSGQIRTAHAELRRQSARLRSVEACAHHWWRAFLAARDPAAAYAAWVLFLRSADRRAWVWMGEDARGSTDTDAFFQLKMAHARLNQSKLKRVMKKREEKLGRHFLNRTTVAGVGPWSKEAV